MYIIERRREDGVIIDSKKRPFRWLASRAFAELVLSTRMATGIMTAAGGIESNGTVSLLNGADQDVTTVNVGGFVITCRKL